MTTYTISIEHPEFSHAIVSYTDKAQALKEAETIFKNGNGFVDGLSLEERKQSSVVVYDGSENIYCEQFQTKTSYVPAVHFGNKTEYVTDAGEMTSLIENAVWYGTEAEAEEALVAIQERGEEEGREVRYGIEEVEH